MLFTEKILTAVFKEQQLSPDVDKYFNVFSNSLDG